MEILKKIENEFLNRTEMQIKIPHKNQPTPTKELLKSEITNKFKVKPEKVEVKYIFSQKNRDYSIAKAFIKQTSDKGQKKEKKKRTQDKPEKVK